MKIFTYLLLICACHSGVSTRNLNHFTDRELRAFLVFLEEEYAVKLTKEVSPSNSKADSDNVRSKPSISHKAAAVLDDQVDIALWNELNDKDIKNMPTIDNYSDEAAAARWLKWYLIVVQRYRQVRSDVSTRVFCNGVVGVGQCDSLVELRNEHHCREQQEVERAKCSRSAVFTLDLADR